MMSILFIHAGELLMARTVDLGGDFLLLAGKQGGEWVAH